MESTAVYPKQDIFLWLKRPVIAEMRAVLEWAHKRALREDIRYEDIGGGLEKHPSDKKFEDIVSHIDRDSKGFFRIIVRKGFNRWMALDDAKKSDILDIGIHCVEIGAKYYHINFYLSATLLGQLRRKFPVTEHLDR